MEISACHMHEKHLDHTVSLKLCMLCQNTAYFLYKWHNVHKKTIMQVPVSPSVLELGSDSLLQLSKHQYLCETDTSRITVYDDLSYRHDV